MQAEAAGILLNVLAVRHEQGGHHVAVQAMAPDITDHANNLAGPVLANALAGGIHEKLERDRTADRAFARTVPAHPCVVDHRYPGRVFGVALA